MPIADHESFEFIVFPVQINDVLLSVSTIMDSLQHIENTVDAMVGQFRQMEDEVREASNEIAGVTVSIREQ